MSTKGWSKNRKATCHPDKKHFAKGLCKTCHLSAYHLAHPLRRRGAHNKARLKQYGLTQESYAALLAEQDGKCAACGIAATENKWGCLHIDHDHLTGSVRGLLCKLCNVALGACRDDIAVLRGLTKYLSSHLE